MKQSSRQSWQAWVHPYCLIFLWHRNSKEGRISVLELPGLPLKADWKLIWLKQKKHSPAVKAFIRWLSENRKQVFSQTLSKLGDALVPFHRLSKKRYI